MKRGLWIGATVALLVLLGGLYLGSPYLAANALREAARDRDRDKLAKLVDFPAVREGLKSDLNTVMVEKFNSDPELKNNPFAAMALTMIPGMVGMAVDAAVTPDGLTKMIEDGKLASPKDPKPEPKADTAPKPDLSLGYRSVDIFVAERPTEKGPLKLVMSRQGLFFWKLTRIELPPALFSDVGAKQPGR